MQQRALEHVRQVLHAHGMDSSTRPGQQFRSRIAHIRRVCLWVDRLLEQGDVADPAPLRLAAAFHDVGYAKGREGHGPYSAEFLRAYGRQEGLDEALVERAAFLVTEHSNKGWWLPRGDAPRDLVYLMEADLLDEEGAMGIALDCLSAGSLGLGYEETYRRMQEYEPPRLARNPMVTPLARAFWARKQQLIASFMESFAFDLGIDDEA